MLVAAALLLGMPMLILAYFFRQVVFEQEQVATDAGFETVEEMEKKRREEDREQSLRDEEEANKEQEVRQQGETTRRRQQEMYQATRQDTLDIIADDLTMTRQDTLDIIVEDLEKTDNDMEMEEMKKNK